MEMISIDRSDENERDNVPFVYRPKRKFFRNFLLAVCVTILITQFVTIYVNYKLISAIDFNKKVPDASVYFAPAGEYQKFENLQKKLNRIPMFCDFIISKKDDSCDASVIIDCIEKVPDTVKNVSSIMHLHIDTITEC
nr:ORF59 [Bracoviriform inaniti]